MKLAVDEYGDMIQAQANAPQKACCPHCGGIVTLRYRRRSNQPGDVTYFWRHDNHGNPNCFARSTPFDDLSRNYE